ncbi:TPA: hypothetical protein DD690_03685 [Candidatus Daviesbacteria bacterium]|nr:MAG: hypothetical protein A3E67_03930 [Candidatus Daviesbacteria bacterium RIFCSPHIGHO2_12_FULL_38_25]OGE68590.1 MAG: hypothetical protein A3H81_02020 [Candidatus Daviesbacteria bacterium RIFCSPLOWO2_02_FULL_38_18]HBQ51057.1 hypothetical protein [Candidatus Daviesbacteria bacterium]HCB22336.1 hypothetical protein [Candidatus Daviesbacteria bacterium]
MSKKAGLILVIIIVGVVVYNLLSQILEAMKSGERLSFEAESLFKLEAENKELKKKLVEIKSPDFIEEQARNKLGLGKPGETVVIIPDEKIKEILQASDSAKEIKLPNPLGWWRVFFR